jgi:uncharacterized membrane protein
MSETSAWPAGQNLSAEVQALARRIQRIEQRLGMEQIVAPPQPVAPIQPVAASPMPAPAPIVVVTPATAPVSGVASSTANVPPLVPPVVPAASARPVSSPVTSLPQSTSDAPDTRSAIDWENLIGGKWALWLGATSLFLALAFFMAYTWKSLPPPPPWARVAMGVGCGTAFLVGGAWSRSRAQRWFSEGLFGGGLAILYLSIWAAAQHFRIMPLNMAFAAMTGTTALGVWLAVRYDARALSLLATCGGFLTPVVLQASGGGAGNAGGWSLFGYVAVLNAGILATSLWKRWRDLMWVSFAATIALIGGWAGGSYSDLWRWPLWSFASLYFLMFLGATCFYSLKHREATAHADLLLLFASTAVYTMSGQSLLYDALGRFPSAFVLSLSAGFALLSVVVTRRAPENQTLRQSCCGLALFFATLAIPIQLQTPWVAVAWSAEAALLLILARRLDAQLLLRAGQVVWLLAFLPLLTTIFDAEPLRRVLFFNEAALPWLLSVLATWSVLWVDGRRRQSTLATTNLMSDEFATVYAVWAVLGVAGLMAREIWQGFAWWGTASTSDTTRATMFFVLSLVWAVYAPLALWVGLRWKNTTMRACAGVVSLAMLAVVFITALAWQPATWMPFVNLRVLSLVTALLSVALSGYLMARQQDELSPVEREVLSLRAALLFALGLCALSLEVWCGWFAGPRGGQQNGAQALAWILSVMWSIGGCGSVWLGCARRDSLLRGFGLLALSGSVGVVLFNSLSTGVGLPLLNGRFMAQLIGVATLALAATALHRYRDELGNEEALRRGWLWSAAAFVVLWALTGETYHTVSFYRQSVGANWTHTAQMAISLVWCAYGASMLIAGIRRDLRPARLMALGLLAFTSLKVFTFDLSFLDAASRILAFAGLGLALLFISWLYGRYGQKRTA